MPQPTPLKTLLSEQAAELDSIQQRPVSQREFLSSVSPLLAEGSPARSRPGSSAANGGSNRASPLKASSPQKAVPSPTKSSPTKAVVAVVGPPTEPASPPAPDAYMNDLPLPPYGSTAHLALHVTETLELALRILKKNQQVGRQLTDKDEKLLAEIASFAKEASSDPAAVPPPSVPAVAPHSDDHTVEQPMMAL